MIQPMLLAAGDWLQNKLNIIELFSSVQGETSLSGKPTTFIRLAACNLRCTWCDTTYSFGRGTEQTIKQILNSVKTNGCRYVCVTGGEPLLQKDVHGLMKELCNLGYVVSLETGGSFSTLEVDPRVKVILDVKCPNSGMETKNLWTNLDHIRHHDEIKFVIADHTDYLYAQDVLKKYRLAERVSEILFSPVHGQLDAQQLVQWILIDRLPVRLNLQIHKFIWSPDTKGV